MLPHWVTLDFRTGEEGGISFIFNFKGPNRNFLQCNQSNYPEGFTSLSKGNFYVYGASTS